MIPDEIDVNKLIDRKREEIQYIGTAKLSQQQLPMFEGDPLHYTCLANLGGMLTLVEVTVTYA